MPVREALDRRGRAQRGSSGLLERDASLRTIELVIDDLHWSDVSSLEFVLYLLHRVAELPAAIVMMRRPSEIDASTEALDRIAGHPRVWVETLTPLGQDAVELLTRQALGERADASL